MIVRGESIVFPEVEGRICVAREGASLKLFSLT